MKKEQYYKFFDLLFRDCAHCKGSTCPQCDETGITWTPLGARIFATLEDSDKCLAAVPTQGFPHLINRLEENKRLPRQAVIKPHTPEVPHG